MRPHRVYGLLYSLLVVATLVIAYRQPAILDNLRNFAFDTFQRIHPPAYDPNAPVRILAIDERSLEKLGQWPWPRTRIADIVTRLQAMGAAAIGFDILFAEPDRSSLENVLTDMPDGPLKADLSREAATAQTNDSRLAGTIADAPVVLGVFLRDDGPLRRWPRKAAFTEAGDPALPFIPAFATAVVPLPVLAEKAAGLGSTNWIADRDEIVRQVPLFLRMGDDIIPTLSLESLRIASGTTTYVLRASNASATTAFGAHTGLNAVKLEGPDDASSIIVETGASGLIRPRYTRSDPRRFLSAADLIDGRIDPEEVRGRIILVGTTASGLGDYHATPLDATVPGIEIHAQAIESVQSNRLLSRPDWAWGLEVGLTIAGMVILGWMLPRVPALMGAIVTAWMVVLLVIGAWGAFDRAALLLDPAFPALTLACAYLCGASFLWQTEQRSRRHVRHAFGKFLAPAVVARIAENPKLLKLSGETRDLTILFSDVRNFSTISETLDAHQVAHFLNAYLTPMTDTIIRFEGTVDKYIGDAIVAFWNAPLDIAEHTARAVDAALAMREALATFNLYSRDHPEETGRIHDVRMGIGLNFGSCSVGNMGSAQRFDYSALGDPVNVAARLEGLTKTYAVDLLATVAVVERTADHAWLEIDEVTVKGRSALTKLYTVVGGPELARSADFLAWRTRHERMLDAARSGRMKEARLLAKALAIETDLHWRPLYDKLAEHYADRDHETPAAESIPVGALLGGPDEAAEVTSLAEELISEQSLGDWNERGQGAP